MDYYFMPRKALEELAEKHNIVSCDNKTDLAGRLYAFDQKQLPTYCLTTYDPLAPPKCVVSSSGGEPCVLTTPTVRAVVHNLLFPLLSVEDLFALRGACKSLYHTSTKYLKELACQTFRGMDEYRLFAVAISRHKSLRMQQSMWTSKYLASDKPWIDTLHTMNSNLFNTYKGNVATFAKSTLSVNQIVFFQRLLINNRQKRAKTLHPLLDWNGRNVTYKGHAIVEVPKNILISWGRIALFIQDGIEFPYDVRRDTIVETLLKYESSEKQGHKRSRE